MTRYAIPTRRASRRQGTVLVCVLGCIATILVVGALTAQFALRSRLAARTQRSWLQVQFLAEAGTLRAIEKLSSNIDYTGETWAPGFVGTSQFEATEILITVQQSKDASQSFDIQIVAKLFNLNSPERALQSTQSLQINQNQLSDEETKS